MKPINCMGVGHFAVPAEWKAGRHAHDFVEMLVMFGGSLAVRIGSEDFEARAGDVLYYPPECSHEEHGYGNLPIDFICFGVQGPVKRLPYLTHDSSGRIRLLASWLLEEQSSYHENRREVMDAMLGLLLEEVIRERVRRPPGLVESVRSYMKERIADPVTVTEIAAHANMSRAHFIRTYKRLSGRTPMKDLQILRVEAARDILITSNEPLKTIVPKTGFCDESHLSRAFRSHFRVSPGYFRKR